MQQRASICRALIHQPRMLLLDEPFGALDAFTREELWCVLRDLWQAQRFNVIPGHARPARSRVHGRHRHVMSQRPGRILLRKEIGLPRPRDLDLTYTEPFAELRARAAREDRPRTPALMMTMTSAQQRRVQRVAPWILLGAVLLLWQGACLVFDVSDFILPSPASIATALFQYWDVIGGHARRTFWTTMAGFALAIGVGVVLEPGDGLLAHAYAAGYPLMTAFNALPKAAFVPIRGVVRPWRGAGHPDRLPDLLLPIMVNIATGLATLEPELEDVLRVLGAKRRDVLFKVGLPRAMPFFFASLKVAITLAFVGTTVSR